MKTLFEEDSLELQMHKRLCVCVHIKCNTENIIILHNTGLSAYLPLYLSVCPPPSHLPVCLSVPLSLICLPASICMTVCLCPCLSVCLPARLSLYLFVCLSPSLYLFVCPGVLKALVPSQLVAVSSVRRTVL